MSIRMGLVGLIEYQGSTRGRTQRIGKFFIRMAVDRVD